MSPPLAELTAHAQTLTSAGDLVSARNLLAPALDPSDADPRRASPDLATAAALHARILIALGDPHGARMWAGFAHAAQERLHGPHDERTVAAAATHAAVLARVGNHGRAAQLYLDLVGELTLLDGPDSPRVLAAAADLATAEHAAGHCTAARGRLADAWTRYRRVYGDAAPGGIKMLARLGALERECGRLPEALHHLTLAEEMCARHLPADHPLARQVTALRGAEPSGRHTCGRVTRSTGPDVGPGVTPVRPQHRRGAALPPGPGRGAGSVAAPAPGLEPGGAPGLGRESGPRFGPASGSGTAGPSVPAPAGPIAPDPDDRFPPGPLYPSPRHRSDVDEAAIGRTAGRASSEAPSAVTGSAAGETGGRHARVPLPAPGHHPPVHIAGARHALAGGAPDSRLLPVPVARPEPASSRQPFVLAAALVTGIGVAAAVVAATLPRGENTATPPTAPAPAPAASVAVAPSSAPAVPAPTAAAPAPPSSRAAAPPPAAAPAPPSAGAPAPPSAGAAAPPSAAVGAPSGVRLQDNRDGVTLTWAYPEGSEGPVLISGGRTGEPPRAFQQLPAGSADYVVYGLNEQLDYCFTVAVVYSTERVATSAPVCTARR